MNIHHADHDGERRQSGEGPPPTIAATSTANRSGAARWDLASVSLILIALTLWVLCHPYRGIVHDNRIYALLAFNYLDPVTFARDVFLRHGSQDSFTLFSPLYAGAITLLGLDWSTKLLVVLGQAVWVLGAFALVRRIMAPPFSWLALLFLAAYPPFYGGNSVFAVGEGFLSPRLYAEAMGLFAIAAFLGSRYWLAVILIALGGVLHPLMIAAPAGVILVLAVLRNRPWWTAALVVAAGTLVVVSAMAAIHLSGSSLLAGIDPEWRSIISNRTGQLLIANWTLGNWLTIACDVMLVGLACLSATPKVRQLLVTVLAIGLASIVTSFVAFDLLGDVITGKVQIWRALWLLHVMAPVGLALVVQDIAVRTTGEDRRILLLLALSFPVITWLCHDAGLLPFGVSILILLGAVYVRSGRGPLVNSRRDRILILAGMAVLLAIILTQAVVSSQAEFSVMQSSTSEVLASILVGALLAVGGLLALNGLPRGRKLLAGIALLALAGGLLQWDIRGPWRRYMDSSPDIAQQLSSPLAPGELVYWPTDVMAMWGALGNPSFFSEIQGAGAIFNRDTALTFQRRLELVAAFEPYATWKDSLVDRKTPAYLDNGYPRAGIEDLVALCTHDDHPDVVVLAQDIPGAKRDVWHSSVAYSRLYLNPPASYSEKPIVGMSNIDAFFFYRCRDMSHVESGLRDPGLQDMVRSNLAMRSPGARARASKG